MVGYPDNSIKFATMAELNPSGMVRSADQIRDDRRRKGYCDTCGIEPVQCYEIKRTWGGIKSEKVPLTKPGNVFKGICLKCHRDMDPDGGRQKRYSGHNGRQHDHRRGSHTRHHQQQQQALDPHAALAAGRREIQQVPHAMNGEVIHGENTRTNYVPNVGLERGPVRQAGFRGLAKSMHRTRDHVQSLPIDYLERQDSTDHLQLANEYEQEPAAGFRNFDHATSLPTTLEHLDSMDHLQLVDENEQEPVEKEPEHVEKIEGHHRHSPPHRQNSGHHRSSPDRGNQMEEQKQPSLPNLFKNINNDTTNQNKPSGEDEPLDALAQLIAQYCETHPEEKRAFVPGSTVLPDSELVLQEWSEDDFSVMTPDTCFGRGSMASTQLSRGQPSRRTNLTAISETSSEASSGKQRSMISQRIKEPVVPVQVAQPASNNNEAPVQDMESYLESSAPDLLTLREFVESFTAAGADAEAIDTVTLSLIHDNATSMSMDLALFCLTTLWVLARKSDENKRKIIFEDSTFDAIIEAMEIYHERSAEIQTRACGVLWSLSMDPNDRKHVAQGGGCDAILNAMLVHMDDVALQVMALGALKVLSFDNIGKSTLRSLGTLSIVADIMQKQVRNPTIQSEGCVILGNLAVDNANHFVAPVTEKEVDAVIRGILAHPDSLEVHEAACFTLMSLASSAVNVELIRMNGMASVSLELACQKHPEDVGNNISTLLRQLKFVAPAPLLHPMTEQR